MAIMMTDEVWNDHPARISLALFCLSFTQSEVEFGQRVGEGAFGDVYLAASPTFGQVAVKWLKTDKARRPPPPAACCGRLSPRVGGHL